MVSSIRLIECSQHGWLVRYVSSWPATSSGTGSCGSFSPLVSIPGSGVRVIVIREGPGVGVDSGVPRRRTASVIESSMDAIMDEWCFCASKRRVQKTLDLSPVLQRFRQACFGASVTFVTAESDHTPTPEFPQTARNTLRRQKWVIGVPLAALSFK